MEKWFEMIFVIVSLIILALVKGQASFTWNSKKNHQKTYDPDVDAVRDTRNRRLDTHTSNEESMDWDNTQTKTDSDKQDTQ